MAIEYRVIQRLKGLLQEEEEEESLERSTPVEGVVRMCRIIMRPSTVRVAVSVGTTGSAQA